MILNNVLSHTVPQSHTIPILFFTVQMLLISSSVLPFYLQIRNTQVAAITTGLFDSLNPA